jgi:polyvinyl alcohol dehydrogenase (cytochrome)
VTPWVEKNPGWNGWSAGIVNHRFQDAATAGLSKEDVPRLQLK